MTGQWSSARNVSRQQDVSCLCRIIWIFRRELGLRHRAAMGISQVSDAHAVIVSEETGSISVAYKATVLFAFERRGAGASFDKRNLNEIKKSERFAIA